MSPDPMFDRVLAKFRSRGPINADDETALLALPVVRRSYEPPAYLIREGTTDIRRCSFILSGFAIRHKITTDGARQIVSVHMPGDFLDLQNMFFDRSDHNVQALTRVDVGLIERDALVDLALARPNLGRALWADTLVEASIYREWLLNVGRRDARQRIAHLLCEFALRMAAAEIESEHGYEMPLTQEQIGDAVGLTSVHVNRTLKSLAADGTIQRNRRFIQLGDWERARTVAGFSALYLHLNEVPDRLERGGPPPSHRLG